MLAQDSGEYEKARQLYKEAIRYRQQLGDREGEAVSLAQSASLEEGDNNLEVALDYIQRAETIFSQTGSSYAEQAQRQRKRIEERIGLNSSKL
jgi:tetratricopeptide (TPR) repeat protein